MAETRLKVTYSVTSTTNSTQLFKTSYFSKAELEDGTELPSNIFDVGNHAYVFSATGYNVVYYTLTGNTIGDEAFEGMTRISRVNIPSNVTAIGERCFRNCTNLHEVYSWPSLTSIGAGAFDSSALDYIYLRSTALTMGDRVFYGCSGLTDIYISAQTAPSVYQYTFHNVPTGGTLHYSAGSDYSSWLSDDQYYLGYYDWNTDEMGDTTPGSVFFSESGTHAHESGKNLSSGLTYPGDDMWIKSSGCTISSYPNPTLSVISDRGENNTNWLVVGEPSSNPWGFSSRYYALENTGAERGAYVIASGVTDTNGNVYNGGFDGGVPNDLVYHIVQAAGAPSPDRWMVLPEDEAKISETRSRYNFYVEASGCSIDSSHTPTITFKSSNYQSAITWLSQGSAAYDDTYERWVIEYLAEENTGSERYAKILIDGVYDTDGNVYNSDRQAYDASSLIYSVTQNEGTPQSFIRFKNDSTNLVAQRTSKEVQIEVCGCTIDTERCDLVSYTGDIQIQGASALSQYYAKIAYPVYSGATNLTGSVTVRFYDTDGNTYVDTLDLTMNAAAWLEAIPTIPYELHPYGPAYASAHSVDVYITSGSQRIVYDIKTVNCTFTGVTEVSKTWSSTNPDFPGLDDPLPEIHVDVVGKQIYYDMPQNTYEDMRALLPIIRLHATSTLSGYGNFYNQQYNRIIQSAGTPVQKDIKAADTDYSVGSGTGNASTTILTSGCTYDHFTYITGGSFSVTATSGPNNTIVFTYPQNPTTSQRTGYVYITFYDSDGNTYGPQTITFTQQAGSSPGPGPGPDPETGYVLTTLTISDQEQHRYFVEARPGVVYSAAGQYYKTVLACEARYSLYYVNSYGGVDVLPFKEKSWKKSDTVTRFNYSRSFRNNTLEFENVNYMNEIKASWELHTGWMSDESSQRMHELVESTIVYLYDAEEKTYTPVVMTDKKLEYKTYYNQGKKFYNYTVNVEESQSKERR